MYGDGSIVRGTRTVGGRNHPCDFKKKKNVRRWHRDGVTRYSAGCFVCHAWTSVDSGNTKAYTSLGSGKIYLGAFGVAWHRKSSHCSVRNAGATKPPAPPRCLR